MTLHSWSTSGDVPPSAWAAMGADMTALLASWSHVGGATVTGPDGTGPAVLDEDTIAFTVALPAPSAPLAITFARAAGDGSCTTSGHITDGLVVVALARAARHWGALLSWTTDADVTTGAVALTLVEGLFGVGDRALSGQPGLSAESQVSQIVAGALGRVLGGEQSAAYDTLLADVIADLNAVLAGVRAAEQLLGGPA